MTASTPCSSDRKLPTPPKRRVRCVGFAAVFLLFSAALAAQDARSSPSLSHRAQPPALRQQPRPRSSQWDAASGAYEFLRRGEFIQLTIDHGIVSGYISRIGDLPSDQGLVLDQFFDTADLDGDHLTFRTRPLHGQTLAFDGTITQIDEPDDRPSHKHKKHPSAHADDQDDGSDAEPKATYVLNGTLTETTSAFGKATERSRDVSLKSLPEDEEVAPDD